MYTKWTLMQLKKGMSSCHGACFSKMALAPGRTDCKRRGAEDGRPCSCHFQWVGGIWCWLGSMVAVDWEKQVGSRLPWSQGSWSSPMDATWSLRTRGVRINSQVSGLTNRMPGGTSTNWATEADWRGSLGSFVGHTFSEIYTWKSSEWRCWVGHWTNEYGVLGGEQAGDAIWEWLVCRNERKQGHWLRSAMEKM